jgi:hypothetical protein
MIVQGPTMLRLRRRLNALRDIVSNLDFVTRSEVLSLELRISSASSDETAKARLQTKAAEDLRRCDAASETVAKLIEAASSDLQLAKGSAIQRLSGSLRDIIRRHAATARETLLAQQRFTRQDHVWQYPALPLRRDLEHEFQTVYREAAAQLQALVQTANAGIYNEIGDLAFANKLVGENPPIYVIDPEPSISALGQTVAIELDDQWHAWWRLWRSQKQRARKLEELLIAEFDPLVEALVDSAEAELDAHAVITIQRFSQLQRDLVATLKRCRLDLESGPQDQAKRAPDALVREYQRRKKLLEEHIENCARIAEVLTLLLNRCAALGSDADPRP